MKKYLIIALIGLVFSANAQMGGGNWKGNANMGHFYGKVVDSITKQPVPYASVQLNGLKWDSASQSFQTVIVAGQLTGDNGEFSLEHLSVMGEYTLQISFIGYKMYSQKLSFNLNKLMKQGQKAQSAASNGDMSGAISMINAVDKDLGNIMLAPDATQLKTVTVDGAAPQMELKLDKRVFDVSKSLTTTGGTAEDVLKTIPAVNVDIDGNVTLRNASPQIYVDGVPSTLTIDQIPADEIDKVEVITNPSAKYDASAGSGGIINIILKHNKTGGYNGSARAGIDQYGKATAGLDLNLRQNKLNFFADVFYKQIKHKMYGTETKDAYSSTPSTANPIPLNINQHDTNNMSGYFAFVRGGFDYFIDNRNTLTVTGTYGTGNFNSIDLLHTSTDSLSPISTASPNSSTYENSNSQRVFNNMGGSLSFKHLYPKEDESLTASVNANMGSTTGNGTYLINNYNSSDGLISSLNELQQSNGSNAYYVGKLDYSDPLSKKSKLETGLMATINQVNSVTTILLGNYELGNESNTTNYNQQTYAAYVTYSHDISARMSAAIGLRAEQSLYSGQVKSDTTLKLSPQQLLYFFPSVVATYHLTESADLQLSYTTHITRPNFSQLVVNNYSNSENVQIGNPNLKPAYMHSFELNFMKTFSRRNTLLVSAYYKVTYNIIATQLDSSVTNPILREIQYFSTYENANYGYSEGLELTGQNSIGEWLDITSNINFFESGINATNLNIPDTAKKFLSYFAKLNLTIKFPKSFSLQLNGNYMSKAEIPPGGSGGGRWGGGYGGGVTPSASGWIEPNYWLDVAVKKDFMKNGKLSMTLNVKDVFATSVSGTNVLATNPVGIPLYTQTTSRRRDPQFFQFTVSYRFGQTDFSLFKKKNLDMVAPPDTGGGGDSQQ